MGTDTHVEYILKIMISNTQKLQGGPQYPHRKRKHLNIKYLTEKRERATESASDFRNLIFQLPLLK